MRNIVLVMLITLSICACGELSYKRGATVSQLENTRKVCQVKNPDNDIQQCLKENGWSVQKLDSFEILTDFNTDTPEKTVEPTPLETNEVAVQSNQKKSEVVKQSTGRKKMVATNPSDTFIVPSWWKTGVKPDSFKVDSNACVEKLGDTHKPEYKTQTVTFAFIGCMSEKGWKAFVKK